MSLLARGSSMLRNLFRREQVDRDLDAEVLSAAFPALRAAQTDPRNVLHET